MKAEYRILIKLKDIDGNIYQEVHRKMTLTDFEILYGNYSDEIIELYMYKMGEGLH